MSLWTKYDYKLVEFGGVDNCAKCDQFTHVWEMERSDGRVIALCEVCRDYVTMLRPQVHTCSYGHTYTQPTSLGCPECLAKHLDKGGNLD
jgi:hypothetical protein